MLRITRPRACMAFILILGSARADDYSQWGHGLDLYTNTSPDGAYVTSTVAKFPLLVRLNAGNFPFSEALGEGQDVRFADPSGKHLPYQIERWDSTGAAAEVWVKLDSIRGNAVDKTLRILWGKTDAADSSNGASVFDSADGFLSVWHLGGADTLPRANAVAGGAPAVPCNYDGDESRAGIIGWADSLDGAVAGDYLDLGPGYADFSGGFTYSVWAKPASNAFWSRLLDLGNGAGIDNIVLQRHLTDDQLDFQLFNGTAGNTRVTAPLAFLAGEWQQFTVTAAGKTANIYRNGILVASEPKADTLPVIKRLFNYIGKSNWPNNEYYRGLIDEAALSRTARSADWIKLSYASQNASQNLLSFLPPSGACAARFETPKDTVLPEGSPLDLIGIADCANAYHWEVVSGPGPRILDPEVKTLTVALPRVAKDAAIKYRFTANYADAPISREVNVTVKEAVPDPAFTLPAAASWNGRDSLLFKPKITNLAALRASGDSLLNWSWTLSGPETDTAWRDSGLMLKSAKEDGGVKISLCLDNGGPAVCKTATVTVANDATALRAMARAHALSPRPAFDARGRRLEARPMGRAWSMFGFLR